MWNKKDINEWYSIHEWLVGCNYLPSSAINQLEMFQNESFDLETNKREISWASDIGFNSLRIYLHDLLWQDKENFKKRLNEILSICVGLNIKPILVLFDDCHRPFPKLGKQPLPVRGVHNSVGNKALDTKLSEKLQRVIRKKKLDLDYLLRRFSMIFETMKES